MSLQPRINYDHLDLPAGLEQGDYWGSPAFVEEYRPLVSEARARLCLSPLLGTQVAERYDIAFSHPIPTITALSSHCSPIQNCFPLWASWSRIPGTMV